MTTTVVCRTIHASPERVFEVVADVRNFQRAAPHVVKVEFLTDSEVGLGTRFRETRVMNGRQASTELEVTEYVANERVRLTADSHGTVWDSLFTVKPAGDGQTELRLVMEARAHKLLPRLVNPLIRGVVQKAIEKDLDAVKHYCET